MNRKAINYIIFLFALLMMFTLVSCKNKDSKESNHSGAENNQSTTEKNAKGDKDAAKNEDNPDVGYGKLTVVSTGDIKTSNETSTTTEVLRGGTNQQDALLLPLNTKLQGKTVLDGGLWYAFTTRPEEEAVYTLTLVNKSTDSYSVKLDTYDKFGKALSNGYLTADPNGLAETISLKLPPNETYYIYIKEGSNRLASYSLIIRDQEENKKGFDTVENINDSVGAIQGKEIVAGTNQDDAGFIPLDMELSGKVTGKDWQWYAFTTLKEEAVYTMTMVNKSPESYSVKLNTYDKFGKALSNGYLTADSDGKASTKDLKLPPETTYYVAIRPYSDEIIDYSLVIRGPQEKKEQGATIQVEEKPLVFEKPFELNSTQVMFQAEKDIFIDENAAKEALKPVADIILSHPDHPILLAGTTATDGDQSARVDLSNRRAAAVKNLLISAFGVPESQLKTVGLGFEADPFVRGQDRDANGKFIESEGAKNRRVIIMDAEDPIAKDLLK